MSTRDRHAAPDPATGADDRVRRVAIVVSRFPKFTETFVVNEVLALDRLGLDVRVHPLLPVEPEPHQPAARRLVEQANFGTPWGASAIRSFGSRALAQPMTLARIVALLATRTWRRPRVLLKDLALLPRICAIADDLEREQVQHVHAHFATHAGFAAFSIGRLTNIPYSIVAHGSDVHRHQLMLREKVREAAFVATVSEFNRQVLRSVCDRSAADRIEVVRVGVDLRQIGEPDHVGSTGADDRETPPLVLCVGTLHEVKGQRYLVSAIAELVERGRSVRLQLIGDGEDRPDLEQLVTALGVESSVEFTGAISHDEVLRRYPSASIVVAPSVASTDGRKEGIPTVLIEAMAWGTSVIASDLAGISELVEHEVTGLLTPPRDVRAIADAIERILDDPSLATRLGSAATRRVRDEYDVNKTAAAMYDLMDRARS